MRSRAYALAAKKRLATTKGQLISEQIYAFLNFPNMQRTIARISALGQIKKVEAHYQHSDYV